MEGAASAANSRCTSLAASRAPSPDLRASEHAHAHAPSPESSLQHVPPDSMSPSELQNGHATAMHQEHPATGHAAADCDTGQAASQPSSPHSSPALSKQQASIPSVTGAVAAEALPVSVATAAAPWFPSEASAAESGQTDSATVVQDSPHPSASKRSHTGMSNETTLKDTSSTSGNMLRQSDGLAHDVSGRSTPDSQQMQPALSSVQLDLATHEAPKAPGLPESSALQPPSDGPSDGQSSCSDMHSLTSPLASVSPRASCPSDSMHSLIDSRRDSPAAGHANTVGPPAAQPGVSLHPVCSPNSVNSSLGHSLDDVSSPPGDDEGTAASNCSQAPVDSNVTVEDTASTRSSSGSAVAAVEAGIVLRLKPAQSGLISDMKQPQAGLATQLHCPLEHSTELAAPSNLPLASHSPISHSPISQSGSSNSLTPRETMQGSIGQTGALSSGSRSDGSASAQEAQYDEHLSSGPQVCNPT